MCVVVVSLLPCEDVDHICSQLQCAVFDIFLMFVGDAIGDCMVEAYSTISLVIVVYVATDSPLCSLNMVE